MHGIFDNDAYRRAVLDALRVRKGLAPLGTMLNTQARKDAAYDRLADVVRQSMNMDLVYRIMNESTGK
jgi:adenosylcobyric acid synthase